MQLILNIPDPISVRVVDGICKFYNYSDNILQSNGTLTPNPETKNQFAKRMLIEQTKIWVATIEGQTANKTTYDTALSELTIT